MRSTRVGIAIVANQHLPAAGVFIDAVIELVVAHPAVDAVAELHKIRIVFLAEFHVHAFIENIQ